MGQGSGGYERKRSVSRGQQKLSNQAASFAGQQFDLGGIQNNPLYQQALQTLQSFQPGGQGFTPIAQEAQRNFQQQTIPQIMNAFGTGSKSSSSLNQALAGAGQNLNSSLAAQQSEYALNSLQQLFSALGIPFEQGIQAANVANQKDQFAFTPKATPFWQEATLGGIQAGGNALRGGGGG